MEKLEIIFFYCVFVSIVALFWTIFFKIFCPRFIICGLIAVTVSTILISAILITKCFIEIDKENKFIIESIKKALRF